MMSLTQMLAAGAVAGALFAVLAVLAPRLTRRILFLSLVYTSVMYIAFAAFSENAAQWIAIEIAGLVIYGGIAYRGLNGSVWWLVAGWLAHPLWDTALHIAGPGRAFAPSLYAIPCITFDIAVAAILAAVLSFSIFRRPLGPIPHFVLH